MSLINASQLGQICPTLNASRAAVVANVLNATCDTFKIAGADFNMFLAQVAHESGEFNNKAENMDYSAERMAVVWPGRYAVDPKATNKVPNALAKSIEHNPAKIANITYANRMGNGNEASGDGFAFRGRGWMQLTGRDSYTQCGTGIKVDLVTNPNLLLTDAVACQSACWEYAVDKKLLGVTDINIVTKRINGGLVGLDKRIAYFNKVKAVLG